MPMQWVAPDLFMTHEGVKVYHCYRHETQSDRYQYHYTTDVSEQPEYEFDVRDLPAWEFADAPRNDWVEAHQKAMRHAIENGLLDIPENPWSEPEKFIAKVTMIIEYEESSVRDDILERLDERLAEEDKSGLLQPFGEERILGYHAYAEEITEEAT